MLFQTMSNATRLAIYLLPVTIISFALNIPKFLEVTVKEEEDNSTDQPFEPTSLRTDPSYIFWYLIYSHIFWYLIYSNIFWYLVYSNIFWYLVYSNISWYLIYSNV